MSFSHAQCTISETLYFLNGENRVGMANWLSPSAQQILVTIGAAEGVCGISVCYHGSREYVWKIQLFTQCTIQYFGLYTLPIDKKWGISISEHDTFDTW